VTKDIRKSNNKTFGIFLFSMVNKFKNR